jgi:hypothetical protein
MYDIIFFADIAYAEMCSRSYAVHRLATDLRAIGYKVLCVHYCSTLTYDKYLEILDSAIGNNTLVVGFSTTWFPYKQTYAKLANNSRDINRNTSTYCEYTQEETPWFFESLSWNFTQHSTKPWIDAIKERNSNVKVVVGGTKAGQHAEDPNIDHVVIGLGDTMMLDLVRAVSTGKPMEKVLDYDNTAQKDPNWDFKDSSTKYIPEDLVLPTEYLGIEFSRGCIFKCAFCSFPLIGQSHTREYVKYKNIIYNELLENYEKWGIKRYFIIDDTFNDSVEKLQMIKEVVDMLPFKPSFWAYVRIDLIGSHPEMAQLMLDIGIEEVNYGLETLKEETGRLINKGNPKMKKLGLKIAREVWGDRVRVTVNYILGLPKESSKDIKDAVDWYISEGHKYIDRFYFNTLTLSAKIVDKYASVSELERNKEKFGYKLDPIESDPLNCTKDDGTDITHRSQCIEMESRYQAVVQAVEHHYENLWHMSVFSILDDRFGYDVIRDNMTLHEYRDTFFLKKKTTDYYKQLVDEHYWPKLFDLLKRSSV